MALSRLSRLFRTGKYTTGTRITSTSSASRARVVTAIPASITDSGLGKISVKAIDSTMERISSSCSGVMLLSPPGRFRPRV